ncbi:MAG: DUF3052 family protein [Mycetocola sp.]
MAGYSASGQARKLGVKPGLRVLLDAAPVDWSFDEEPDGVEVLTGAAVTDAAKADIVLCFVTEAASIAARLDENGRRIYPAGSLWMLWPRKAAGHTSDVTENLIRDAALERGLVDVKVAAVSEDWSGLKIVWRVENRASLDPPA